MAKFIYMRHASTEYSKKNLFMGRKDLPIISIDDSLITTIIEKLKNKDIILLYSPLQRAKQTAQYIATKTNIKNKIEEILLVERDFGEFEGHIKSEKNRLLMETDPSAESRRNFQERVIDFFIKYSNSEKYFLIVGHSSFYREAVKTLSIKGKKSLKCCEFEEFDLQINEEHRPQLNEQLGTDTEAG